MPTKQQKNSGTLTAEESVKGLVFVSDQPMVRIASNQTLMKLLTERVGEDDIFEENPPFFFEAMISNDRLDSHFTRMSKSTLRNYAEDAKQGVAFMAAHNHNDLPFGSSLDAKFTDARGRGASEGMRTTATFYTIRDLKQSGVDTNEWIKATRAAINRDVSVGFYFDENSDLVCDIDGFSYFSGDCRHWLGMRYTVEGKDGPPVLATGTVDAARLSEVSSVYDGSTPGAQIATFLKAQRAADAGRLMPNTARALEAMYGQRIKGAEKLFAGFGPGSLESERMGKQNGNRASEEEENEQPKTAEEEVEETETEVRGVKPNEQKPPAYAARDVNAMLGLAEDADIEQVRASITALSASAKDGKTYRETLVKEAIAEHARAFGDANKADAYRAVLEGSPIEVVAQFRDDWRSIGDSKFKPGRATVEGTEDSEKPERKNGKAALPLTAFS